MFELQVGGFEDIDTLTKYGWCRGEKDQKGRNLEVKEEEDTNDRKIVKRHE